jgi:hypothetical protein
MISDWPPAPNGTTILTGRVGQSAAPAPDRDAMMVEHTKNTARRAFMAFSRILFYLCRVG